MFDTHAHVFFPQFDGDRDAVLERAWSSGLRGHVEVGTNAETSRRAVRAAASDLRIWATVGIHPHDAGDDADRSFAEIEELARSPRVVGIGECGLDRGPHNHAPFDAQVRLFRRHVGLARATGLALVVHNRDTYPELFAILDDEQARHGPVRGVMHCFSGGPAEAERSVALGFHVSFSGVLTFKSAQRTRDAAAAIPETSLLVETDAPYLAPEPHRGKRNEPSFVAKTLARLAEVRGRTFEEMRRITEENARRAFGLSGGGA